VVILGSTRTPLGRFLGGISTVAATELGATVVREAVRRAGIAPENVDECIMGQVLQGGSGQAPARQAAIRGGLPPKVTCLTVNKVCGSGLMSVILGARAIRLGESDVVVAGGMESMSLAPYAMPKARTGARMGNAELVDLMVHDGLWCSFENWHMGSAAEHIARRFGVSRAQQDEFAAGSHAKAVAAWEKGRFAKEVVAVEVPQRKGQPIRIERDEGPREDTTVEALAKLAPAFEKGGTVTAGNAPGIFDGASALVIASRERAEKLRAKPIARVVGWSTADVEPKDLFYAPVLAVRKLDERIGVDVGHWDLIEANEAFSAQALADGIELGWDWNRVNVNGGAVALGHPIGASGARVLTTLLHALEDRKLRKGLATLCLGGGGAVALGVEMER
jgi:acetyl-CoA C-acetyltransferase